LKVRAVVLALLLVDLAAGATWFAGRYGGGRPEALRLFLVWALPGLVFLCGMLTLGRREVAKRAVPAASPVAPPTSSPASLAPQPARSWPFLLAWIGAAIAVDLGPIAIGHRLGWLTWTNGDPQLAASRAVTAFWALPLLALVSIRFYERTLRGQLFRRAREIWGSPAAWTLTVLCGTALALPAIAPGFSLPGTGFAAAALVTAGAREVGCTVLYRASGLVAAGLYRGALAFVDFYVIADRLAPAFPSANYVASGDSFYLLRAASPLLAALLLARVLGVKRGPA
jgi:hypothetical protein